MKRIAFLFGLVCFCVTGYSQGTYPVSQNLGAPKTLVVTKGGMQIDSSLIIPKYPDTSSANISTFIKKYPGSLIRVVDSVFMRSNDTTRWIKLNDITNISIVNYESRIVSGSAVWDSNMVYTVSDCFYYIGGILYNSSETQVTLNPADSSNPRIDVIYLDTAGNVGVITGIPSPDPVKPVVDPITQIELTHINIYAQGSTPAEVAESIIYNENLQQPSEWNTSISGGGLNPNYAINPYVGSKSFFFGASDVGQDAGFSYSTNEVSTDSIRLLSFYLRQNSVPPATIGRDGTLDPIVIVRFWNNGFQASNDVRVVSNFYGYKRDTINKYQLIAIDVSTLTFTSYPAIIDSITITITNTVKDGVQIDYIRWQFGGGTPPPNLTNFWSLDGNDIASKPNAVLGTTSKNPLSIVVNGNPVMNLDLDNRVNLVGNVELVTDTAQYKPLVINTAGTVAQVDNWGAPGVTSVGANPPLSSTGGVTPVISISAASSSTDGYLTQADWTTFNNKLNPNDTLNLSARIDKTYDTVVRITDTSFYLRKSNGITKDTIVLGNSIVYTEDPIMSMVSNDSNIIYFNPDTADVWRQIGWELTGNSNTTAGVNFLGTTNNVPLEFRVNNSKSGIIDSTNKNVGLGYNTLKLNTPNGSSIGTFNVAIGHNALSKDTFGIQNVAIGGAALGTSTTNSRRTVAIGYAAMNQSRTPLGTVAIGWGSMARDYYGSYNTAVGADVANFLAPTVGDTMKFNTLLGFASAYTKKNGSFNVFVGDSTGASNQDGSGNIFIGSKAGKSETGSNLLYISNSSTSNPLIKGNFADSTLRINGKLSISTTSQTPDSSLDVTGGVRLRSIYSSNNASDSMLVIKSDGAVGLRAIGGSGSTPNLSQVLAVGDTADNRILLSNGTQKQLLETSFGNSNIYTIGGPSSQNSMSSNTTVSSITSVVGSNFISQTAQAGQATIDMASDSSTANITVGDKIFRLGGFDTVALARIKPSLPYDMYYMPFTTSANNKDTLATLRDIRTSTGFVPYVGATQDVDLGNNKLSARSVYIEGTNGDGHLHLKHQNADATATGQSTSLYADSNGDIKWKNDNDYYTTLKTSTNTANRVYTYPDTSTTLIGAADTSVFQRKNIASYSFKANNTNAAADATDQVFRDPSIQTYTQTITWTGTAPSGATNHTYNWTRVGNIVTLNVTLVYATAGSTLTAVSMPLPTDCPTPKEPTGLGAASEILYLGTGQMTTSNTATNTSVSRCFLRVNSADNGYELGISGASGAYKNALLTIQYFVN